MLAIPQQYASLKFIRPIAWPEIFESWRKDEEHQKSWKELWEERGFSSWEEWRKSGSSILTPEKSDWYLYEIKKPLIDVPIFWGIPSIGWITGTYNGKKTKQIKDIFSLASNQPKIKGIRDNFPDKTTLIGIIFRRKIIILEGMHRSCAIASRDKDKRFVGKVYIALMQCQRKEMPIFRGYYKNKEDIPALKNNK
jgi:hypothetical protein